MIALACCLHLQGSHPALQLLRHRIANGSLPNDRADKFKLGLVVEGGGMRGAVSAGGLLELGNLGFRCHLLSRVHVSPEYNVTVLARCIQAITAAFKLRYLLTFCTFAAQLFRMYKFLRVNVVDLPEREPDTLPAIKHANCHRQRLHAQCGFTGTV